MTVQLNLSRPLYGHLHAVDRFLSEHKTDQLHHAWLLRGPSGIGKSLLAVKLSAVLLGARNESDVDGLQFDRDDPIITQLEAGSHPDFRWVRRQVDEHGKLPTDIPTDEVRSLVEFFGYTTAAGGFRVAVVDSIDELNRFGANTLLKTLEEPPGRSVLFLISHQTKPILPTISSRCRRITLSPLSDAEMREFGASEHCDEPTDGFTVPKSWHGRPGKVLDASERVAIATAVAAGRQLAKNPHDRDARVVLVRTLPKNLTVLEAGLASLLDALKDQCHQQTEAAEAGRKAKMYADVEQLFSEARKLNMEAAQTTANIFRILEASG